MSDEGSGDEDYLPDEEEERPRERPKRKGAAAARGAAKRSRRGGDAASARQFIDIEAAEGDGDDEDDEGGEDEFLHEAAEAEAEARRRGAGAGYAAGLAAADAAGARRGGAATHLESTIGDLERRFQGERYEEEEENEADDYYYDDEGGRGGFAAAGGFEDGAAAVLLQEDAENARLWLVRVTRASTEREAVIAILNKAIMMRQQGVDFPILSAFAADGIKGFIYVEAPNVASLVEALSSFRNIILSRNIKMVPPKDLRQIFHTGDKEQRMAAAAAAAREREAAAAAGGGGGAGIGPAGAGGSAAASAGSAPPYALGDTVLVRSGDLAGLIATVTSVDGKTLHVRSADGSRRQVAAAVAAADVMKHFEVGASVTVVSGVRRGDSGLVTGVDQAKRTVTVFSPVLGLPFTVPADELSTGTAFVGGPATGAAAAGGAAGSLQHVGGFGVGDLVQLAATQTTGVVVRIDASKTFTVLDVAGTLQTVPLAHIMSKRSSDFSTTIDGSRNMLTVRSPVAVLEGPHRGTTGRVLHIWRQRVFARLPTVSENGGIIVTDGRKLRNTAAAGPPGRGGGGAGGPGGGFAGPGFAGAGPGGTGGFRPRAFRPSFGRPVRVRISGGVHKGSMGDVRSAEGLTGHIQVTLVKSGVTVSISKNDMIFLGSSGGGGGGDGFRGPRPPPRGGFEGAAGGRPPQPNSWGEYFGISR